MGCGFNIHLTEYDFPHQVSNLLDGEGTFLFSTVGQGIRGNSQGFALFLLIRKKLISGAKNTLGHSFHRTTAELFKAHI